MSGKLSFPRRIWTNTYSRVLIALLLCFTALALGTAGFFDFAEAAPSGPSSQQQPSGGLSAEVKASPKARAALQALQATTGAQIVSQVSRETGAYNFVRATDDTVLSEDNTSAKPEARAFHFLRSHGALVGMSEAERQMVGNTEAAKGVGFGSELRVAKTIKDSIGSNHVRLNQFYQGLPVFGAQLVVHMNERGITAINGNYVPDVKVTTTPAVSAARATATALQQQAGSAPLKVVKTELSIYRKGLLEGYRGQSVLAYNVEVTDGRATNMQVWVDAMKGTVLNRIQLSHPALDRIIYTPEFNPLFAVRHEGDPLTPGQRPVRQAPIRSTTSTSGRAHLQPVQFRLWS